MKPGDTKITCEWEHAGQQRAYGPSVYSFTLKVEWIPYAKPEEGWKPSEFLESVIKQYGQSYHKFYERSDKIEWHQPVLKEFHKINPGQWYFQIEEAYTD